MKGWNIVALTIGIIGAINWGLIGFFNFNLVESLFGIGWLARPSGDCLRICLLFPVSADTAALLFSVPAADLYADTPRE